VGGKSYTGLLTIFSCSCALQIFQAEPDFDLDIKEDVQEECSKFGVVKHIFVVK
jgi:hypothetical protein